MKAKSGLSIIEILVASLTLVFIVSAATVSYVSIKQVSRNMGYLYTAMNLAKEVLEFGEAATGFNYKFAMKYYYAAAASNSIPADFSCGNDGIRGVAGYGIKEWRCFNVSNDDPFDYMGDIQAKGLVPKRAPNSVVIYYKIEPDINFYGAYKETVEISWKDEEEAKEKKVSASVIPIRHVNNQLRLTTAEFWWE